MTMRCSQLPGGKNGTLLAKARTHLGSGRDRGGERWEMRCEAVGANCARRPSHEQVIDLPETGHAQYVVDAAAM